MHCVENKLRELESKYNKLKLDLNEYDSLSKEIKKLNKVYDEIGLVKKALSSKEGIPLRYTLNYLGNIENITNELLDIAYNGEKYIDKFDISPNSFSIPFYNKGVRLPDVKYASQGELSFLSIALSFALASQTLKKYNIMLLDEIDGPLDTENREKFIRILENQIERIESEQNFLITHNDMFASYPIDIIDLSENRTREYPLANYITVERK
jgi:DNA repair exonuclease SbcCD ATPase subunit